MSGLKIARKNLIRVIFPSDYPPSLTESWKSLKKRDETSKWKTIVPNKTRRSRSIRRWLAASHWKRQNFINLNLRFKDHTHDFCSSLSWWERNFANDARKLEWGCIGQSDKRYRKFFYSSSLFRRITNTSIFHAVHTGCQRIIVSVSRDHPILPPSAFQLLWSFLIIWWEYENRSSNSFPSLDS